MDKTTPTLDYKIAYKILSCNLGLHWIEEKILTNNFDALPDIIISVGFDMLYNKAVFEKYWNENRFISVTNCVNSDYVNDMCDIVDKRGQYSVIASSLCVLAVNKAKLNGRKMPETWNDILDEEFENSVALPPLNLDVFNTIALNIYKSHGEDGIKKLARSCASNLHPSEMVKGNAHSANDMAAISIIPYFFAQMIQNKDVEIVFPLDGAMVSPLNMLLKREKYDLAKPFIDFILSKEASETYFAGGKFPSTNPDVKNNLPDNAKLSFVGFDYIYNNDVSKILIDCERIFRENYTK